MWSSITFKPADQSKMMNASKFRDALASRIKEGRGIIFNCGADKNPLHAKAFFRFAGGKDNLQIFATTPYGTNTLREWLPDLMMDVQKILGPCVMDFKEGKTFASTNNTLRTYYVGTGIMQRHAKDYERFKDVYRSEKTTDEYIEWAENKIRTYLDREFKFNGLDVPDYILGELEVQGFVPALIHEGRYMMASRGISFQTDLYLSGVFNIGHLINRGYGLVKGNNIHENK